MAKTSRNYKLLVERGERTFEQMFAGEPAGELITIALPFTIDFDVSRNKLSSLNVATFRVYNLKEATRNQIFKDPYAFDTYRSVELQAGYDGQYSTVFKGNILQAFSHRENVDFITTILAQDGGYALANGEYSGPAFNSGMSAKQMFRSIALSLQAFGVSIGAIGSFDGSLRRGNTQSGNTLELLQTLSNGGCYVDLEKLYILGNNECIEGPLSFLNADTGLLDSPIREKGVVHVEALFEPRITLFQRIELQSRTVKALNGIYQVGSIHHQGTISAAVCGSATTKMGLFKGIDGELILVPLG